MIRIILKRLLALVPTVLFVTIVVFLLRSIIPGGPAAALLGTNASDPAAVAQLNHRLGLDRPLYEQYLSWLGNLFRGDLGTSFSTQVPVSEIIVKRFEPTLLIVAGSVAISTIVGVAVGIFAAVRRTSAWGRLVFTTSGLGLSLPSFWVAAVASAWIGVTLGWLPAGGYVSPSDSLIDSFRTLIMPVLVLALTSTAMIARQIRAGMATALASPYVRTARAMGISHGRVNFDLAFRNAVAPLITLLPLVIAGLVGGSVIVESVFNIPGIGGVIVDSVSNRDYVTMQAMVLLLSLLVLLLNLVADVALMFIDPRIRDSA
ncbi:MAG: ABC transporter permease [Ilumatobacteraceae bacterium]